MSAIIHSAGIDVGFSDTKACFADGTTTTFPSLVGPTPAGLGVADIQASSLRHRQVFPQDLLIGEYAYMQKIGGPDLTADWFQSPNYMALVLASLDTNRAWHSSWQIVTGLPVEHLDMAKQLEERIAGTHTVQWAHEDEPKQVAIQARVVSQGIGALATILLDEDGTPRIPLAELRDNDDVPQRAIADCGAFTFCCVAARGFYTVREETGSIPLGAWTIEAQCRRDLTALYGEAFTRKIGRHELLRKVRKGTLTHFGKPVPECAEILDAACRNVADKAIAFMHDLWSDTSYLADLILTGGGGLLLEHYLKEAFPSMHIVAQPLLANAIGYSRLAKLLLR